MSDKYVFSDHVHEPERPIDPFEVSRYARPMTLREHEALDTLSRAQPTTAEKARWNAEIEFERHLLDDDDPKRVERWRLAIAEVLIHDCGMNGERAGLVAGIVLSRLKEPL